MIVECISVEEFAAWIKTSVKSAYDIAQRHLPDDCKVKLGNRVRILVAPTNDWIRSGGSRKSGERKNVDQQVGQ